MARSTVQARVYCLKCGMEAQLVTSTMDPQRPIVLCAWTTKSGQPRGCGRQLGGYNQADVALVISARQQDALVQLHNQGRRFTHKDAGCPSCVGPDATRRPVPHEYEPIPAKLALVRHLTGPHAYGLVSELTIYAPLVELTSVHQRLHLDRGDLVGDKP